MSSKGSAEAENQEYARRSVAELRGSVAELSTTVRAMRMETQSLLDAAKKLQARRLQNSRSKALRASNIPQQRFRSNSVQQATPVFETSSADQPAIVSSVAGICSSTKTAADSVDELNRLFSYSRPQGTISGTYTRPAFDPAALSGSRGRPDTSNKILRPRSATWHVAPNSLFESHGFASNQPTKPVSAAGSSHSLESTSSFGAMALDEERFTNLSPGRDVDKLMAPLYQSVDDAAVSDSGLLFPQLLPATAPQTCRQAAGTPASQPGPMVPGHPEA